MKIFSNFDTQLKNIKRQEYEQEHGVDNVLMFGRSKPYLWLKVIFPIVSLFLVSLFVLIFFYRWLGSDYFVAILIFVLILFVVALVPLVGKYIDYSFDFIIVIPSCIMMYDQWWLFKRKVMTISAQSIKMISIKKDNLLYSIFDNGDLVVLTEWDVHDDGEIVFRWVSSPETKRNKITRIVWIDDWPISEQNL